MGNVSDINIHKLMTLVDAQSQSHRFRKTGPVSLAFGYPQVVSSVLDIEVKIKLELKSLFENLVVAMFFRFIKT